MRFVYDFEQQLCWDAAEKLPGRGWWLAIEKDTLLGGTRKLIAKQGAKKGQEEKGQEEKKTGKKGTGQPDEQGSGSGSGSEMTAESFLRSCALMQEQRCLSFIALARRAGLAVAGAGRSLDMAYSGGLRVLITTPQSSREERRKILKADRRVDAPLCCARFSALALGRVFAREEVVYVGVGGKAGAGVRTRAGVRTGATTSVGAGLVERLLQEIDRFERLLGIFECESVEEA